MKPKQCIPMTDSLLARMEEAFELPFVSNAQRLDLTDWCRENRSDLLDDLPLPRRMASHHVGLLVDVHRQSYV